MSGDSNHIIETINSSITIFSSQEIIWENITNVKIENVSEPIFFKLLDIPKPIGAELFIENKHRVAYFNTNRKFIQKVLIWKPFKEYSFSFNPEKGFKVGYIFDISDGVFRLQKGKYSLITKKRREVTLKLETIYSLDKRVYLILNLPIRFVLKKFQKYLLKSIKKNSEE